MVPAHIPPGAERIAVRAILLTTALIVAVLATLLVVAGGDGPTDNGTGTSTADLIDPA